MPVPDQHHPWGLPGCCRGVRRGDGGVLGGPAACQVRQGRAEWGVQAVAVRGLAMPRCHGVGRHVEYSAHGSEARVTRLRLALLHAGRCRGCPPATCRCGCGCRSCWRRWRMAPRSRCSSSSRRLGSEFGKGRGRTEQVQPVNAHVAYKGFPVMLSAAQEPSAP